MIRLVEGVAETAPIVANRVAALLSKMFAFALDRDLVTASPAVRIPRPGTEQARDREKRAALDDWARSLAGIMSTKKPKSAAVVRFRRQSAR